MLLFSTIITQTLSTTYECESAEQLRPKSMQIDKQNIEIVCRGRQLAGGEQEQREEKAAAAAAQRLRGEEDASDEHKEKEER